MDPPLRYGRVALRGRRIIPSACCDQLSRDFRYAGGVPGVIGKGRRWACLALVLAALWGIRRGWRRIDAWIERRYKEKIERHRAGAIGLFQPRQAWRTMVWALRVLRAILVMAVTGVTGQSRTS